MTPTAICCAVRCLTSTVRALPTVFMASIVMSRLVPAQEPLVQVSGGDGRVHGAPVLPVSNLDLQPGEVQAINLRPRQVVALEFPYPIGPVIPGDADVVSAWTAGGDLLLRGDKDSIAETNLIVVLRDRSGTLVPLRVRIDSTQPQVDVVRFTDPIGRHLNQAEAGIARRLEQDVTRRVGALADERVNQTLLLGGNALSIDRHAEENGLVLVIENAQTFPGDDGRPRVYVRYRVLDHTVAPLADLAIVARVEEVHRRWGVFEGRGEHEITGVRDIRSAVVAPAGGGLRGVLIVDPMSLTPHQSISIEAIAFNNTRHVKIEHVFVGN